MRMAGLLARVMVRLAALPGLSFLQTYVTSARGMKARFGQRKGDYEAYLAAGTNAYGEVRTEVGGESRGGSGEGHDGAEYDEEDAYEEDYYDYEDDEDPVDNAERRTEAAGDYPSSDEYHSYYDDDYRSS